MRGLLTLSILCGIIYLSTEQAAVKVAISNEQITIAKDAFLPYVIPMLETAHFPNKIKRIGLWDWTISDTKVSIHPIDVETQAQIKLIPNSNLMNISIEKLTLNQSQHYQHKRTGFDVIANITDIDIYVIMELNTLEGHPNITCQTINVTADKKDIKAHIEGMGLIDDILDAAIGVAKGLFFHNSIQFLEKGFVRQINNMTNVFVNTLPPRVVVGKDLEIRYYLPQNPYIIENYLTVALAGELIYKGVVTSESTEESFIPDYDPQEEVGVQIFISQDLIENVADVGYNAGVFKIENKLFFKGYVSLSCEISKTPELEFTSGIIKFKGSTSCRGTALHSVISFQFTTSISGRVHQSISNSKLVFQTASASFPDISGTISIFGFDLLSVQWFKLPFDYMLNGLEDILNQVLGNYPLALPKLNVIQYPNLSENVQDGYLRVFASVSANNTAITQLMDKVREEKK